jgi:hypothetical protein
MEPITELYPADIWYLLAVLGVLTLMLPTWLGVVLCTFALIAWWSRRSKRKVS